MKKNNFLSLSTAAAFLLMEAGTMVSGAPVFAAETEVQTEVVTEAAAQTEAMTDTSAQASTTDSTTIRIGALSGPTAMGLVKLMQDSEDGATENTYQFADLSTDPSTFVAPLAKGEIDIAAVPSNLASVIYHNTEGGVKLLAINTLGVLEILERGDTIHAFSDLKGKTLYATGQGATPEYSLRYLLTQNGLDPDQDLTIQWCSDTTEALSYITQDEAAIAMVPQPFATVAQTKVEGLRIALDLNDEWTKLDDSSSLVTGVVVARTDFIDANPELVQTFLSEYEASIQYTQDFSEETAALIEKYGIVPAAVAAKALPSCHLTYLTGEEMKTVMSDYLTVLYDQNPQSIGGSLPEDDFYYINETN